MENQIVKQKKKHPGGRPTKYHPDMGAKAIELMRVGASLVEVAAELDVCIDTIHEWRKKHKRFSDAIKTGIQLSNGWWERQGRENLKDKDFSYTGWYMNMKNRFGWRDKHEVENKGTLQVETIVRKIVDPEDR